MAVSRFITVANGAQCVILPGILMMLMLYVVSWASLVHPLLPREQNMVKGLVLSGSMVSIVKGMRHHYYSVVIENG